jgi:elongation factor P
MASANELRRRTMVRYNGDMCLVEEIVVRTPPNNRAYVQMELRSLTSGKAFPIRTNVSEEFEVLENRSKTLEFSYENQGEYVFMDPNTFDTYELQKSVIESALDFISPGQKYEVLFVEDNPVRIDLPASVEMKVAEAMDAVGGNTSGNVRKIVKLETGLEVEVPLFIKTGDIIKVNTDDKKYQGRA